MSLRTHDHQLTLPMAARVAVMDHVKSDTTLSFSFAEPSPALAALLGQATAISALPRRGNKSEFEHVNVCRPALAVSSDYADLPQHSASTVNTEDHSLDFSAKTSTSSRSGEGGALGDIWCLDRSASAHSQNLSHNHMATISDRRDTFSVASGSHTATDSTGSHRGTNSPVAAGHAAKLKRKFSVAMGQNPSGTMKVLAEHDPENHDIKRLREQGHRWSEIADKVNKQRVAAGKIPGLTDNAVYSRYTRNAPRIAAAQGEVWDPKTVGPHPSKKTEPMAPITGFDDLEDQRLVEAYAEIQRETWELVSDRLVAKGGKRHDPELCARRYQSI